MSERKTSERVNRCEKMACETESERASDYLRETREPARRHGEGVGRGQSNRVSIR